MITKQITYQAGGKTCIGYLAYEDTPNKKPVVMVVPALQGCTETFHQFADQLAALGYIGFAIDTYGDGFTSMDFNICFERAMGLFTNRQMVRDIMVDTYEFAKTLEHADASKIASIGFCIGGLCSLDLARSGADVQGVASFHGTLIAPGEELPNNTIKAQMLVMTGNEDPQIPPEQIQTFCEEMKHNDFQVIIYSNTKHGFMDPTIEAIVPEEKGCKYNPTTATRAWQSCTQFLTDLFH